MKYICSVLVLLLAVISISTPVCVAAETKVYICDWYDYGYDCILIIDDYDINDIDYDI